MARINIDEPRWDQSTYEGRANHFFTTTNPLNLLCSERELENARTIVVKYRYSAIVLQADLQQIFIHKYIYIYYILTYALNYFYQYV